MNQYDVFPSAVESAQDLLTEFLEVSKQMLIDDLDINKRNATGKTKAAIRLANVTPKGGQLLGPEHVLFTFQGRAPGKMPPLSKIIDWCVARRIPRSRAWIIAKKISESGTELFQKGARNNNALLDVTSQERIDRLTAELKKLYTLSLKSDLQALVNGYYKVR